MKAQRNPFKTEQGKIYFALLALKDANQELLNFTEIKVKKPDDLKRKIFNDNIAPFMGVPKKSEYDYYILFDNLLAN